LYNNNSSNINTIDDDPSRLLIVTLNSSIFPALFLFRFAFESVVLDFITGVDCLSL